MKNYSPYQFSFFRIIFGIYLVTHFAMLLPYAEEIWSNVGLIPDASLNLTHGFFPNILNIYDSSGFVQLFIGLLLASSFMFLLGVKRQLVSIFLWYGWVCLFDRNNLISNPGIPFIGWLLLCCCIIPNGEPLSITPKRKDDWNFPKILFIGAWVIMSVSYTISGFDKFNSPSWRDGTAIIHLLNNPLARDLSLRTFLLSFPEIILKFMTWAILFIEMAFLPFAIFNKTRKWIWLLMIGMHIGILLIVDFADLTLGMLMIHWFTFDGSWLKPTRTDEKLHIVFFDGYCGLCNSFINFLLKEDRNHILKYSALQGETAKNYINTIDNSNLKTVIFFSEGKIFTKLDAIIEIFKSIGGIWKLLIVFKILPKKIKDFFYEIIALNRIKWFGQKETCRMPKEKEKEKILI